MEGADKVVYFTHDYTSMCPDKNDFLVGTAKLAKKHGVKSLAAVCPLEHDMAYTEDQNRTWVQVRQDAEQSALSFNKNMAILNTDLVFSNGPAHMLHYMAQKSAGGKIPRGFLQDDVCFNPVHSDDVAEAVAHVLATHSHGQFAVQGDKKVSLKELMGLVDQATGCTTSSQMFNNLFTLVDEFFTGHTVDKNLLNIVLDSKDDHPISGASFWEASGLTPQHDVHKHYAQPIDRDQLAEPSRGDYKLPHMNF